MTGQAWYDSDGDAALHVAAELVNVLAVDSGGDPLAALREVLAVDPQSVGRLRRADLPRFTALAQRTRDVLVGLAAGDVDLAAAEVNALLAEHSAQPHLAVEGGRWRLHHHPPNATLVGMWTAIVAGALARLIDAGRAHRAGLCAAPDCGRVFVDQSKNGSRRFCSLACQNRVKAAAYRARRR